MANVRRYGPSRVDPMVQGPQPVLDGEARAMAGFASVLGAASDFLRPAAMEVRKRQAETDLLGEVETGGPSWEVRSQEAASAGTIAGLDARPVQGPNLPTAQKPPRPKARPNLAQGAAGGGAAPVTAANATFILPGFLGMGDKTPGARRNRGLTDEYMATVSAIVAGSLGKGWDVRVKSGGQYSENQLKQMAAARGITNPVDIAKFVNARRTGSTRHDVHDHGKSGTADFVLSYNGKDVTPDQNKKAYAKLFRAAAPYFPGIGHYGWGVHIGGGNEMFWGPNTRGQDHDEFNGDLTLLAAVREGRAAGGRKYGQTRVEVGPVAAGPDGNFIPQMPDMELVSTGGASFERRLPFTYYDAAFNEAAERVIGARARQALYSGASIAAMEAGGDLGALNQQMDALRSQVMGDLPASMTGLAIDMETEFETQRGVAVRQAIGQIEKKTIAGQTEAFNMAVDAANEQAQWLALSGASTSEIQGHLVRTQRQLAQFGPREAFTFNGVDYPADRARAGIMSVAQMGAQMQAMGDASAEMMIRGDFERSTAKGAFVSEMRKEIFAGRSPLPPGQALQLLGQLEVGVRAEQAQKEAAARAAAATLKKHTTETINPYVSMTEAGAPIAIPAEERAAILADLEGYPALQREAEVAFATADAAVATHGMTGGELSAYINSQKTQLQAAAERGEIDDEATAVILQLEHKLKELQKGITADMTGVNTILDATVEGTVLDEIDWAGMEAQAAGKPELLEQIAQAKTVYDTIGDMTDLTADQRDDAMTAIQERLNDLAAEGKGYGKEGVFIGEVLGKLDEWSTNLTEMARSDATSFAKAKGIEVIPLDGETTGDLGAQVAQRVLDVSLAAEGEGVLTPVPLDAAEKTRLKGLLDDTELSATARIEFLEGLAELPMEQSTAVLEALGGNGMYAIAGSMARLGRTQDAEVMLFGTESDLTIPNKIDRHTIRQEVAGAAIAAGYFAVGTLSRVEDIAEHYAIGFAARDNKAEVEDKHMQMGYEVAFGMDSATKAGGVYNSNFGPVILPDKWTTEVFNNAMGVASNPQFLEIGLGAQPFDTYGKPIPFGQFMGLVGQMNPVPGNQYKFFPADDFGNTFIYEDGSTVELDVSRLWALGRGQ